MITAPLLAQLILETTKGAVFDGPGRKYRLTLWRRFRPGAKVGNMLAFIGLNPSTADEYELDNTCRQCMERARRLGFDGYIMLNAFAYKATKPKVMKTAARAGVDVIGQGNDEAIKVVAQAAGGVVACWGADGSFMGRSAQVRELLSGLTLYCITKTVSGEPGHPLYKPYAKPLEIL